MAVRRHSLTDKDPLVAPRRIVILRALQLGDLLCTVPAFRALRAAFPQAEITMIGLPWTQSFVDRFQPYLDHFIEFPGFPGFPEREPQLVDFPSFLQKVQEQRFDLALQMHGSGHLTNHITALFGARRSAGFYLPGAYHPSNGVYLEYPEHEHEVWRHLRLMELIGIPLQGETLEFPLDSLDRQSARELLREHSIQENYAIVHPGSRAVERRWRQEHFALVADNLARLGLQVLLTGTREEADLTAAVADHMRSPAVDLAGRTQLGTIGALLAGARLLVSNDTGVSHVAAALDTPSVVIFLASDPAEWAPIDRSLHRPVDGYSPSAVGNALAQAVDLVRKEPSLAR